jgi:hypothetical protein
MASSVGAALIGLGGVVLGGGMTMLTVWWQTVSSRKNRLAELELQLQHERILRDEAAKRSALLELLYVLRRFSTVTVEVQLKHKGNHRGIRPGERTLRDCNLDDVPDLKKIGQQYCDLLDKYATLADETTRDLLEIVHDGWNTLYLFKRHFGKYEFEKYGVTKDEYCAIGADACCLELMIQGPEFHLERILNQSFLGR